jgi:hypothetical protein
MTGAAAFRISNWNKPPLSRRSAMKPIRTACPSCCATLRLEPDQILLAIGREPPATYTVWCPACSAVNVKQADAIAEWLLRSAGVVPVPAASTHPESPPGGPSLGYDDLLDLHLLLATEEWLDTLLADAARDDVGRSKDASSTHGGCSAAGLTNRNVCS